MATLSQPVRDFLEAPHFAVVATIAPDGMPHQTVVWYAVAGDDVLFSVPKDTIKHRNLARDPRMSICVEEGFRYVTLTGNVSLEDDPSIIRAEYMRMGERYSRVMPSRPPVPSAKSSELMSRERVGVRLKIERVVSQGIE